MNVKRILLLCSCTFTRLHTVPGLWPKDIWRSLRKEQFLNRQLLFDDHEGMPAAKVAKMNIHGDMGWAADSKLYPEVMDQLGLKEQIGFDKRRFEMAVGRMDSTQRANFDAVYEKVAAEFIKEYPSMTEEDIAKMALPKVYAGLSWHH